MVGIVSMWIYAYQNQLLFEIIMSRPDKKTLFKKQLFDLEIKGQGPMKVITVCDTPPYGHAPTYQL
jgi:hypothetical protein